MPSDVRRAVRQMGSLLGLNMLGDVAKPLHADILRQFLEAYLSGRRSAQSIPACVEEAIGMQLLIKTAPSCPAVPAR